MLAFSEVPLVAHNAPFDILHLARLLDAPFVPTVTDLMARTTDTMILAHLVDPREKKDGGIGHGLKALSEEYVDPDAPDSDHELKALFKSFGLTVGRGFAEIDVEHPTFLMYAGMDVGLTARLHEVLPMTDVLVVALALTAETTGIIGRPEFDALPDRAMLVNVARGGHVVTSDLVDALQGGRIAAAALDVTDPEPLPDGHPLWSLPNCLITPHIGNTPEMGIRLLEPFVADNVRRFCEGRDLLAGVDVALGY
jgi:hypothetical protein